MKKITSLISLLLLTHFAIAQNPYDVSIKTENFAEKRTLEAQAKRETFGKCKFVNTFDFKEGERFIFEKNETAIKEGRDMQWYFLTKEMKKDDYRRTKLSYKDYAGKIVKIIKFEEKKGIGFPDTSITFEVEDTKEQISLKTIFSRAYQKEQYEKSVSKEQIYTFPYLLYLPDIDTFKENYLDKTFFTKFIPKGRQYQPVKITKVGAGDDHAPIRIVFENSNGEEDYKDVSTCGSNVPKIFIDLNYVENFFTLEDPKKNFKGSEEIWDLITQGKIRIGMTESELIMSWGEPKKINETFVSGKISKQYVYYNQYVYVDNGLVSSFQSSK